MDSWFCAEGRVHASSPSTRTLNQTALYVTLWSPAESYVSSDTRECKLLWVGVKQYFESVDSARYKTICLLLIQIDFLYVQFAYKRRVKMMYQITTCLKMSLKYEKVVLESKVLRDSFSHTDLFSGRSKIESHATLISSLNHKRCSSSRAGCCYFDWI